MKIQIKKPEIGDFVNVRHAGGVGVDRAKILCTYERHSGTWWRVRTTSGQEFDVNSASIGLKDNNTIAVMMPIYTQSVN